MFNFIFENTKIVDILAPISSPYQQLHLAIQHHRQQEVQQLVASLAPEKSGDNSGSSSIHIACRYNNRYALELLLNSGATVDTQDRNGNIGLHYAAKSGHLDMCKFLVERGSNILKKNSDGKTAYDVTENHLIRQYLLPLQLTAERQTMEGSGGSNSYLSDMSGGMPNSTAYAPPPPPPPTMSYAPPPHAYGGYGPPPAAPSPPPYSYPSPTTPSMPPTTSTLPADTQPLGISAVPLGAFPARSATNDRRIMPDGFHSSASDPVLQRKYGHVKETVNIAPPPTGATMASATTSSAPAYSAFGSPPPAVGPPPSVFNRYVAYDAHTNTALPPPPAPPQHQTYTPDSTTAATTAAVLPQVSNAPYASPSSTQLAPPPAAYAGISSPLVEVNLSSPPGLTFSASSLSPLNLRPAQDVGIGSGRALVNIHSTSASDSVISANATSSSIL